MLDHPAQSDLIHGSGLVSLPLPICPFPKGVDYPRHRLSLWSPVGVDLLGLCCFLSTQSRNCRLDYAQGRSLTSLSTLRDAHFRWRLLCPDVETDRIESNDSLIHG